MNKYERRKHKLIEKIKSIVKNEKPKSVFLKKQCKPKLSANLNK